MPTVFIDGIATYYESRGYGSPLLLFSPGGFDARLENWSTHGSYVRLNLLERLAREYTCIAFDKRESGRSGGRVERLSWTAYAAQGLGLLDHLGIERAYVMGGCVGCSIALALAVAHPERVNGLVLYAPAGGPRYRIMQHARFAKHLAFAEDAGLAAVVALAREGDGGFGQDPRVGPWASVIRRDAEFAHGYTGLDVGAYRALLAGSVRLLFDRDTVPGVEPEDLLGLDVPALIVPGQDMSHTTSAARYLDECLPRSEYWDVPVVDQTELTAPPRILGFLARP